MATVKSFSVGTGDMYYISHNSHSQTIIDCNLRVSDNRDEALQILVELEQVRKSKTLNRFILTHPDEDHLRGLPYLEHCVGIDNWYFVESEATKVGSETEGFRRYKELRADAFPLTKGLVRVHFNSGDQGAGLSCRWPVVSNKHFQDALAAAKKGSSNNISPVIEYSTGTTRFTWMGDLEQSFMEKIKDALDVNETTVLFAPHHGRDSGFVPKSILLKMKPKLIVIGEADSGHLNYYQGWNTITQNRSGDIAFVTSGEGVHVYTSKGTATVGKNLRKKKSLRHGRYAGTI